MAHLGVIKTKAARFFCKKVGHRALCDRDKMNYLREFGAHHKAADNYRKTNCKRIIGQLFCAHTKDSLGNVEVPWLNSLSPPILKTEINNNYMYMNVVVINNRPTCYCPLTICVGYWWPMPDCCTLEKINKNHNIGLT